MKLCSIFMAVVLLALGCFAPANAVSGWDVFWADEEEAARGIIMQPGADETQRNFSWYTDKEVDTCSVLIGTDPLLLNAETFEGELIDSYQGDKVAKVTVSAEVLLSTIKVLSRAITYFSLMQTLLTLTEFLSVTEALATQNTPFIQRAKAQVFISH